MFRSLRRWLKVFTQAELAVQEAEAEAQTEHLVLQRFCARLLDLRKEEESPAMCGQLQLMLKGDSRERFLMIDLFRHYAMQ